MRRPDFIARQARNAQGPLGRAIAAIMARETWAANAAAIDALDVQADDCVLDVGSGPGRALQALALRAPRGRIAGIDPSELMAEIAVRRNAAGVRQGRVSVAVSGVEALPFASAGFDKVLCVHVVYFWPNLRTAFVEIARVTRPGGLLALVFRAPTDPATRSFPAEIYRFPSATELADTLAATGFAADDPRPLGPTGPLLLLARKLQP